MKFGLSSAFTRSGGSGGSGLKTIMDVVSTAPAYNSGSGYWEFTDTTGNNYNVNIKNNQYLKLNGTDNYVRSTKKYTYLINGFKLNIKFSFTTIGEFYGICGSRGGGAYVGEWFIKIRPTNIYFYYNNGTQYSVTIADAHVSNRLRNIQVVYNNNIFTMTLTDSVGTNKSVSSSEFIVTPAKSELVSFGNEYIDLNAFNPISLYEAKIENTLLSEVYLDYKFEDGDGSKIYDASGNGNDANIVGTLTNAWSNYSNQKPNLIINGYTLYQNISTLAYLKRINPLIDNNLYIIIISGQSNALRLGLYGLMVGFKAPYIAHADVYEYNGMVLIYNTEGGQAISYWDKDTEALGWTRLKSSIEDTISYAQSINKIPVFLSMAWLQGESDISSNTYPQYLSNLRAFVSNCRAINSTYLNTLEIQLFKLSNNNTQDEAAKLVINNAFDTVANENDYVDTINTDNLTFADQVHFNNSEFLILKGYWFNTFSQPIIYNSPSSDYQRIEEISKNVFGRTNIITVPVNEVINQYLPTGDYTFDQLWALITSKNLVITKTTNQISNLKVKI